MLINPALLSWNKPSTDVSSTLQPHHFQIFLASQRLDSALLGMCGAAAEGCWVMAKSQGRVVKTGATEGGCERLEMLVSVV